MGILTSPDRVLRVLGYSDPTLTQAMIEDYIQYSEGYIRAYVRETISPTDTRYDDAIGCATYLAALCAVIRPLGGQTDGVDYKIDEINIKKSTQGKMRLSTADKFSKQAKMYLDALMVDTSDVPESNTGNIQGM